MNDTIYKIISMKFEVPTQGEEVIVAKYKELNEVRGFACSYLPCSCRLTRLPCSRRFA